jgi:hypothetical protein
MNSFILSFIEFFVSADKTRFFSDSPFNFLFTPIGMSYVIILFLLSFGFGFIYQTILKQIAANRAKRSTIVWKNRARSHNIGKRDRMLRAGIGVFLFIYAVTTSWSPTLLFFSGFCYFEAIFSWCGFYAAFGRNS